MNQIAHIDWKHGQYSYVFWSAIVDPSPLKEGEKVLLIWGKAKKEYSATISCSGNEGMFQFTNTCVD